MTFLKRKPGIVLLIVALLGVGAGAVYAQLEGERGVPPINSATTIEVSGIEVDVTADSGDAARHEGWREAQQKAWKKLWANTNHQPESAAPGLTDSALDAMVSSIAIEQEEIGPKRYIARLGVLFDRARTGALLGLSGPTQRSAPMLVLPVMLSGATPVSFEYRNPWQEAWARFRTGGSAIDYVRPVGNGIDPLILNMAQTGRPGRGWWRMILNQYGAADVLIPQVRLMRGWPGGPVTGIFSARHGPDNRLIATFTLQVRNSAAIPSLLDEGVRKIDQAYTDALAAGLLRPDPSLIYEQPQVAQEAAEQIEASSADVPAPAAAPAATSTAPAAAVSSVTLSVDTPDAAAIQQAEVSVSGVGGVLSALTTRPAPGGTSEMSVRFSGDPAAFAAALRSKGWTVSGSGASLKLSRPGASKEGP